MLIGCCVASLGTAEELQGQEGTKAHQEEGECLFFRSISGALSSIFNMVRFYSQLGTLRRAKRKVDELTTVIAEQRRAGH
jgi:hypothetical protein